MREPTLCLGCGGVVDDAGLPEWMAQPRCACLSSGESESLRCSSCGGSLLVDARACPYCGTTLATRRCDGCLAWNLAVAKHCHQCGRTLTMATESEVPPDEAPSSCARCRGRLVSRSYADLDVAECDACGGMLVGPRMMERIVVEEGDGERLRLALPVRGRNEVERVRYVDCPVCGASMNRRAFGRISGVVVDVCRSHGVWFDAGELTRVLDFIGAGGLADSHVRGRDAFELAKRSPFSAERVRRARIARTMIDLWTGHL